MSSDTCEPNQMVDIIINEICSILYMKRIDSHSINEKTIRIVIDYSTYCYLTFYDTYVSIGYYHYRTVTNVDIDYNNPILFDEIFINIKGFLGPKYDQYE